MMDHKREIGEYTYQIKKDAKDYTAYNNRGCVYAMYFFIKEAMDDYNMACKINPTYIEAYYNRAELYFVLDKEKAIFNYSKALQINPNFYNRAFLNRGSCYLFICELDKAIADFDKVIQQNYRSYEAILQRIYCFYFKLEHRRALDNYNKLIEIINEDRVVFPDFFKVYNQKGLVLVELGDYEKAIDCFNNSIKMNINSEIPHLNRGYAYLKMGDYDNAILSFNKAFETTNKYAQYANMEILHALKNNAKQKIHYLKCKFFDNELKFDYIKIYNGYGLLHFKRKNYEKALKYFDIAIKIHIKVLRVYQNAVYYNRSKLHQVLGNEEMAKKDMDIYQDLTSQLNGLTLNIYKID